MLDLQPVADPALAHLLASFNITYMRWKFRTTWLAASLVAAAPRSTKSGHASDLIYDNNDNHDDVICSNVFWLFTSRPMRGIINWARTQRHRKPKVGGMEAHHTGNPWTYLEVKRSKDKVTRPTSAETESASCLPNVKDYELQKCYTDVAYATNCHGQL